MKKTTKKAFTLVEMLIVIVIIGILIAALLPRMQGAQGRARDVSRQTNLSQIATAIISYQSDHRDWPTPDTGTQANQGIKVSDVKQKLLDSGMSDVPSDPNGVNNVTGLASAEADGDYLYMVTKKNGADDAGFVLMASTETEGASNWVVCENGSETKTTELGWFKDHEVDLADISTCSSFTQGTCGIAGGVCTYDKVAQLRYIYMY